MHVENNSHGWHAAGKGNGHTLQERQPIKHTYFVYTIFSLVETKRSAAPMKNVNNVVLLGGQLGPLPSLHSGTMWTCMCVKRSFMAAQRRYLM